MLDSSNIPADLDETTYSGEMGDGGTVMLPWDCGGVVWPGVKFCITATAGGLLVGPAMGFVGALVRASVTTRL